MNQMEFLHSFFMFLKWFNSLEALTETILSVLLTQKLTGCRSTVSSDSRFLIQFGDLVWVVQELSVEQ